MENFLAQSLSDLAATESSWCTGDEHTRYTTELVIDVLFYMLHMGVSENVVYPFLPNGFADHYP